ncbi:hypothetical protein EDD17DRAFT_1606641 [Pisolithus thermaeus]|nr:hypothetical protein EV401DRAFT_1931553 [Pisolithus croceorrhizus]KAI6160080.1 hypothetical protein EDD17DRAFT_1606641 [Pisolithus thermaeus]
MHSAFRTFKLLYLVLMYVCVLSISCLTQYPSRIKIKQTRHSLIYQSSSVPFCSSSSEKAGKMSTGPSSSIMGSSFSSSLSWRKCLLPSPNPPLNPPM